MQTTYTLIKILWSDVFGGDVFDTKFIFKNKKAAEKTCRTLNKRLIVLGQFEQNGHGQYFQLNQI